MASWVGRNITCSSSTSTAEFIHYYRRSNYGSEHIYLVDPVLARQVTMLTNTKTVSGLDIATLEALTGREAVEVPAPLSAPQSITTGALSFNQRRRETKDFDLQTAITARAREITPSDFA